MAWRILSNSRALWLPLSRFKYGDTKALNLDHAWPVKCKKQYLWWRDLRLSTGYAPENIGWFGSNVTFKLGKGVDIDFWNNMWCGVDATSECMGAIRHTHRIIQNRNLSDKFVWWRDQIGFSVIPAHAILLKGRLGSSILHAIEARTNRLI
ncbi:hypothetical protein KIW84_073798 [Lathyrus oleraceus]|uniref:Uncharacterized protein n=1 Tax=Pisum sativum TaxID=3888 RepID=A0A9D4VSA4_PEA|nr:hypothetical protein KIW84_073798 [Pisum sativum]